MERFETKETEPKYEVEFEHLKSIVDQLELDFENGFDVIEYRDLSHCFYYVDDEELDEDDDFVADNRPSEEAPMIHQRLSLHAGSYGDFESKVRKSLGVEKIKQAMIHEVIEADLWHSQDVDKNEAHKIASKYDKLYAASS